MPRANAPAGYSNRLREILFRAAQARIGQELKAYYRPPPGLPRDMFMLLMKLREDPERTANITGTNNPTEPAQIGRLEV